MNRFFSLFFCVLVICLSVSPVFGVAWVGDVLIDNTQVVLDATEETLNDLLGYNGAVTTALNDVIKIVLYGSDMYPALEIAADNAGYEGDVSAYLLHQLTYYTSGQNITDVNRQMFQDGVHVLQDGSIVLAGQMTSWINGFVNWLWNDPLGPMLIDVAPLVPGEKVYTYEGTVIPYFPCTLQTKFYLASAGGVTDGFLSAQFASERCLCSPLGGGLYLFRYGDNIYGFSDDAIQVGYATWRPDLGEHGLYYAVSFYDASWFHFMVSRFVNVSSGVSYYVPRLDSLPTYADLTVTSISVPSGDPGWLIPDSIYEINVPDVYTPTVNVPGGSGGVVTPVDYIKGVSDSLDGDPVEVPVYDPDTGSPVGTVTLDPTGDDLPGEVITAVPENAVSNPFENIAEGDGLGDFHLDINFRDLFPFCIPFDVYDLLSTFTAEAEAPHFEFPIKSEIGGIDETITFDLSQFDSVAATLRKLELVAFAVGLAFVTKQLLI